METASARDQVVEEELSDQEEVRIFYCQVKTASLYRPQQRCDFGSGKRETYIK